MCRYKSQLEKHVKTKGLPTIVTLQGKRFFADDIKLKEETYLDFFLFLGVCQDTIYDYYAPNYTVDTKLWMTLVPQGFELGKPKDSETLFKNVMNVLDTKLEISKSPKDSNPFNCDKFKKIQKETLNVKNMYDDVFEFTLLVKGSCFILASKTGPIGKPEFSADMQANVGKAIHDGWAIKTFFTGYGMRDSKFNFEESALNPKGRSEQFQDYDDLDIIEKIKDQISHIAIWYAIDKLQQYSKLSALNLFNFIQAYKQE